jgi:hypothetical protein
MQPVTSDNTSLLPIHPLTSYIRSYYDTRSNWIYLAPADKIKDEYYLRTVTSAYYYYAQAVQDLGARDSLYE